MFTPFGKMANSVKKARTKKNNGENSETKMMAKKTSEKKSIHTKKIETTREREREKKRAKENNNNNSTPTEKQNVIHLE